MMDLWDLVGSLSREQRRVWFADGLLPNGETTDSSKEPAPNPNASPSQPPTVSQVSNKSTTSTREVGEASLGVRLDHHAVVLLVVIESGSFFFFFVPFLTP